MDPIIETRQSGLQDVTAVILAGGLGTRLRSMVRDRPKVLAEVRGRPFLAYLLDQLCDAGVRRAVLCTGYKTAQIETTFGNRYRELEITYSREDLPHGTAGALRLALPQLETQTLLVMNGDSYCGADLVAFRNWHAAGGFDGSMCLVNVQDAGRYGRVWAGHDHRILRFDEKRPDAGPGWINAGLYVLNRSLLADIPAGRAVSLEREILPFWILRPFGGYRSEARFLDIGTPESYAEAERFFAPVREAA